MLRAISGWVGTATSSGTVRSIVHLCVHCQINPAQPLLSHSDPLLRDVSREVPPVSRPSPIPPRRPRRSPFVHDHLHHVPALYKSAARAQRGPHMTARRRGRAAAARPPRPPRPVRPTTKPRPARRRRGAQPWPRAAPGSRRRSAPHRLVRRDRLLGNLVGRRRLRRRVVRQRAAAAFARAATTAASAASTPRTPRGGRLVGLVLLLVAAQLLLEERFEVDHAPRGAGSGAGAGGVGLPPSGPPRPLATAWRPPASPPSSPRPRAPGSSPPPPRRQTRATPATATPRVAAGGAKGGGDRRGVVGRL